MSQSGWLPQRSRIFNQQHPVPLRSLNSWIDTNRSRLSATSETPLLDAQVVAVHLLRKPRAWVISHPEVILTDSQVLDLESLLLRLERGEPLAYVLGEWEFYGLKFFTDEAVLIPRPETELLVEEALRWLDAHPHRRRALDVGTGSACIAVALAANRPDLRLLACDISRPALSTASRNIHRHALEDRISLVQADLLTPTAARFDLICANLPYIPSQKLETLRVLEWEPRLALDGGFDGLDAIRRLLAEAPSRVALGGLVLLEVEAGQGLAAIAAARQSFPSGEVSLLPDLAGNDRLLKIQS